MDIIQNSKDILYLAIAFSVLTVSVFFAWLLYYFVMIAKSLYGAIVSMRERVHKIDQTIDAIKEKVEHSTSYLLLIGEGIKKLVELAMEYGFKEKSNIKEKKTKK